LSGWPLASSSHARGSILIVAVDRGQGGTLAELLQGAGYTVHVSSNPVIGWDVASTVQAVVLVGSKPNWRTEDICEICAAIRRAAPSPPLIVVGPDDLEAKVRLLMLGADDYIVDSFDQTEFLVRIRCWIRRSRGGEL
jgi:two-component system phosphate regulon response regulator OmpR